MVECPRSALMSIALLRRAVKTNQEVNVRPLKEARAKKENTEDQRKENDRTEKIGEAVRGNKEKTLESLTPTGAEEDDGDRVPLAHLTSSKHFRCLCTCKVREDAHCYIINAQLFICTGCLQNSIPISIIAYTGYDRSWKGPRGGRGIGALCTLSTEENFESLRLQLISD
ncbi:hypothetical protein NDU88_005286 [Pleurodeles waltl]|uniref:Uncharacterized protein n=1 Tax=Pleurodeles waltl TaxID=8319 RepID=A0AAV7MAS4_PLEWA|nr:hypothetical protein NDU88_005286 [Pleurodeles waltl]